MNRIRTCTVMMHTDGQFLPSPIALEGNADA